MYRIAAIFLTSVVLPWVGMSILIGPQFGAFIAGLTGVAFLVYLPIAIMDYRYFRRLDRLGR